MIKRDKTLLTKTEGKTIFLVQAANLQKNKAAPYRWNFLFITFKINSCEHRIMFKKILKYILFLLCSARKWESQEGRKNKKKRKAEVMSGRENGSKRQKIRELTKTFVLLCHVLHIVLVDPQACQIDSLGLEPSYLKKELNFINLASSEHKYSVLSIGDTIKQLSPTSESFHLTSKKFRDLYDW